MNTLWGIVFFLMPILGIVYIGWHIWLILPLQAWLKTVVLIFLGAAFALFFANFLLDIDSMPMAAATFIYNVGTSSIFIALYLVMLFLVFDLGRLLHIIPKEFLTNSVGGTITVLAIIIPVFIYGNWHYYDKHRQTLELTTRKPLSHTYKLVMLSDLHLGYHNQRNELSRWIDIIAAEKPDLVLIAGDIIDRSMRPLTEQDMAAEFRRLNVPVYACLGNHEYYSGKPEVQQFIATTGIKLLSDTSQTVNNDITIVGRDDRTNRRRKPLKTILATADSTRYTIVLDHQPYHLEEAERSHVDFQFSGHTHYGQVWPISWITNAIYECAFGSHQRGNTHYYVSSGMGIWGGKFRIGTRSEYVVATLRHRQQ